MTLRDQVASAIYEEPGKNDGAWALLSTEKRASWLADADRVLRVIEEYKIPEMDIRLAGRPSAGAAGLGKGAARSPASQITQQSLAANHELLEAVQLCQQTLALLTAANHTSTNDPAVSVVNAWAQCVEAEAKARAAISKVKAT